MIEFRDELPELLCHAMADDHSPYKKFTDALQLDLESLTQVMLVAGTKWNSGDANQLDMIVREEIKTDWRPGWGQPAVLWRLAGELIAQRSEFMVPRDWIDVPVPWSQASEHWLDIVHALEQLPNSIDANEKAGITLKVAQVQGSPKTSSDSLNQGLACASGSDSMESAPAASHSPEANVANVAKVDNRENGLTDEAAFIADVAAAKHDATRGESTVAPANSLSVQASTADDDIQRLKLEIEIAEAVDSLVQASRHAVGNAVGNRTDGSHSSQTPRARSEEFVIPKIIIAEVRSHNDPAFVSVVRRQLALCRTEERTMSLLAVKVAPDGEEGNMPTLQSLGLASWQQKLVNWMSDHPEIRDPYAFVSNEGELILSLMDIERNTATPILRQGLVAVLAGSSEDDALLSRPPAPARYHAGIGSVASPAASFEPEQLIEATYRCLDAATRHGKASIKSIEVF